MGAGKSSFGRVPVRGPDNGNLFQILCYGDSNTAGYCAGGTRFVPYGKSLATALEHAGVACQVSICGLSGLTAEELVTKAGAPAIRDNCGSIGKGLKHILDKMDIDMVIIMLGTNDLGMGTHPVNILQYVSHLHNICHMRGVSTLALAPPSVLHGPARAARDYFARLLNDWDDTAPDIVVCKDAESLVPRERHDLWEPDQLHLTPAGSHELGVQLAPKIVKHAPSPSNQLFEVGQIIEYFSERVRRWIPVKVTKVKRSGTIMVDDDACSMISSTEQATSTRIPGTVQTNSLPSGFRVGQQVQYHSASHGRWLTCKITRVVSSGAVELDIKPGYFVTLDEQGEKLRALLPAEGGQPHGRSPLDVFQVGQCVEYYSDSQGVWTKCRVTKVDSSGAVELDIKPGQLVSVKVQAEKIRALQSEGKNCVLHSAKDCAPCNNFRVGQEVEYYSASLKRWLKCCVISVEQDGAVQLDVKPGCFVSLEKQGEKVRTRQLAKDSRIPSLFYVGEQVEYYSSSHDKWLKCRIVEVEANGVVHLDVRPGCMVCPDEQRHKIRSGLHVGQQVELYSASQKSWQKCCIVGVEPSGGIRLDIKPNYTLSRKEQAIKVRVPLSLDGNMRLGRLHNGQNVEYYSVPDEKWIKARVCGVHESGAIDLDVGPGRPLSKQEQAEYIRLPRDSFSFYA